jgi:uncharacterized membrane protein YkvA (DUF1232 family)
MTLGRMIAVSKANPIGWWKGQVRRLKIETYTLYLAYQDPRVPWYARLFAAGVVGYAFSPIDLIPDFVPVLGYLDDLVLVPLGIILALKMMPAEVLEENRQKARASLHNDRPRSRIAASVIIAIWLLFFALAVAAVARTLIT